MNNVEKIKELLDKPIIRNDHCHEFMNKMTNDEIRIWEQEVIEEISHDPIEYMSTLINTDILYNVFKLSNLNNEL